jgi:hypothetical protein
LKSGRATTKDLIDNSHAFQANKIQDKVEDVEKPLFVQSLDELGPLEVEILGIDKKLGFLVSDGFHALTCHLKLNTRGLFMPHWAQACAEPERKEGSGRTSKNRTTFVHKNQSSPRVRTKETKCQAQLAT